MINSTLKLAFAVALVGSLIVSCEGTPERRLEASPSVGVAVDAASPTGAPTEPAPGTDTRTDIYMLDPETGSVVPFLTASGAQTNGEVSPDGERVVYESRAPGFPSQIFVMEPDGTTRQLTHLTGGASDPTWSPDGTQIAFVGTRWRAGDPWPDADVFVMDADGSRIHRLAGTPKHDGQPDWSPDGTRVAFHSRWVNLDGQPAGRIWVASAATRSLIRLTGSRRSASIDPAWSPDGRWIAYGWFGGDILNGRVYTTWLRLIRPNGTNETGVRKSASLHLIENPSWSPDGRSIAFEENDPPAVGIRWDGSVGDVGIIDVHAERLRWIVRDAASDHPSWTPDGIVVNLSPADVGSKAQPTLQTGWLPTWDPSWTRPDVTVVLTGTGCELDGDAGVLAPGALSIEFVNASYREGYIKVVRVPPGRRLGDLHAWIGMAGGWGERSAPSATDVWSSPRAVTSGRWAVVCFKDLIDAPNGFQVVPAGVAGPIEVGFEVG